ncbi:MAG: amino acid ABC transporter substrate-binding protein [Rhodobacteraceae bacterium]|jgi:polar amino acid transport system substrate-binding protein|nr:amino acid ABC transporter substrate-binding protein [Paracoccaceae bacterium]
MKIKPLGAAMALVLASGAAFAQDCTPAHQFPTVTPGALTVGTYELLPFISTKDGGFSGTDAEIIKEIAKMECLEIKTVALDPAALIQAVVAGQIDMTVGNWYRTAARAEVVNLSGPLYLDQMGIISKDGFTKVAEAEGKKVGTVQGYLWSDHVKTVFGDDATLYPTTVGMAQDLAAGRLEVGFESYTVVKEAQKSGAYDGYQVLVVESDERIPATVEPGQSTFPHTKGNDAMTTALDEDIAALRASGRLAEILVAAGLDASAAEPGEPRLIK